MRILFSVSSFGFLRNFQSTIRLLAEHGHQLHLIAERTDAIDGQKMVESLRADHPSIQYEFVSSTRHRLWYALGTGVRASLDYWRYLDPRWEHSARLRARAADQAPRFAVAVARLPILGSRAGLAVLRRLFRAIDRVLPPPGEVADVFRRIAPDMLLLTPLLYFRSHQVDHVRCARQLGIKTVLGVGSWDHLTTKGLIHEVPDRVVVWNEAQKQEAIDLHGVPADRVLVTGAQAYDHWFATKPSVDRETFCRRINLDPTCPILLYLCSSPFIAPHEVEFVRKWITAIRSSLDPRLRTAGLLVRPHPQNARQWQDVDLPSESDNVAVWPKAGVNPIGGAAREDYFDSMYHAEAVVGVNTSAMIESGIIGRPVYTVKAEEFAATQEGTLHFQHLKNVEGGLLQLALDLDEHVAQLARLLAGGGAERQSARRFIQAFIRPHGLDVPATPLVVAGIERFAADRALVPYVPSLGDRLLRAVLVPAAVIATVATMERAKLRSIVLHWTRPGRLAFRGFVSRLIYAARFVRRLPGRLLRLAGMAVRRLVIVPSRWLLHRSKTRVHAFLVSRKAQPPDSMRIFFSMQHLGSFLMYEPVIRELAARGHQLHLAVSRAESLGWGKTLERVLADYPQITWSWLSPSPSTSAFWFELAKTIRLWADYLRYFEPHYVSAPRLRARAEERVPPRLVRLSQRALFQNPRHRQRLLTALRTLERALPAVDEIRQQLREQKPDVVLITPLVYLGSWQFEVLRAAKAEGLRTVFAVGSWDHLSSKALIRDVPERIFVWNETQKDEAVKLHRVPADRIVVTGAQCYDQWFGRVPARTREDFCRHVGLPSDRPFILYVCSALFWGSPVEAAFVRRWVHSLRESSHPELRETAILVRPHPARMDEWATVDLSSFEDVTLYGSNPMDADSKEDYFESLFYSSGVVGLNTSAFLEAAIVGRPLHTILTPEFSENQEGTLHFHYLLNVGGGVLQTSRSFDAHHQQLVASLRNPDARARINQQFVREFIRPRGLDVPATPVFCDAVDDLLTLPVPAPERTPAVLVLLRWAAYPMFLLLRRAYGTELFRDDWRRTDREHQARLEMRERERQARRRAAEETKRQRERRRTEKAAARETAVQAELAARKRRETEKARRLQTKVREKAARVRRRERAAMRARLKRGAKGLLNRWRLGRQGQAT